VGTQSFVMCGIYTIVLNTAGQSMAITLFFVIDRDFVKSSIIIPFIVRTPWPNPSEISQL
jgi:hypothetical protein